MPPPRLLVSTAAALALLVAVPATSRAAGSPASALPIVQAFRTVDADRLPGGILGTADGHRAGVVLGATNRYAMTVWWPHVAPALLAEVGTAPAGVTARSDAIRRLGMEAMSLAVTLRTRAYDPSRVGASEAQARAVVVRIVQVLAANHLANRPGGWGSQGQSTLWESFAGRAGWLMWDDLPRRTKILVQNMIVSEANRALQTDPLYLRGRSGNVLRPGNTAAEENSWTALPLELATATMPRHRNWVAWRHAQVRLMLASWGRPVDVASTQVVNGAPFTTWVDGSNVESNGLVVNHHRVAPDYATNVYQNVDAILVDALAGLKTPAAARWGLESVYASFTQVRFSTGYAPPGGTIYQGGHVYYPQGCDWGVGQALPYALVDAQAAAFGFGTSRAAGDEAAHLASQQRMQARFRDGRTFAALTEYRYVGREEHTAQLASQLYLTKVVRDKQLDNFTDEPFFAPGARDALGLRSRPAAAFTDS